MERPLLLSLALLYPAALAAGAEELSDLLRFSSPRGDLRGQVSGFVQLDYYRGAQQSPGFIYYEGKDLVLPHLTLFTDLSWKDRVYGFTQLRWDRGFDPGPGNHEVRLDEFALRVPVGVKNINVQVGQFATVVGNWAPRHDAWQNPFVGAPLPYEYMTGIYDRYAPKSPYGVSAEPGEEEYDYNPILWGPVYATGAALTGKWKRWDFATEIKNTGPSSRPEDWSPLSTDFSSPTLAARLGYRPDLRLRLGLSYSEGTYLATVMRSRLPQGTSLTDYCQRLAGFDASYEWHRWQIWGEVFVSDFTTPFFRTMRSTAAYLETRYKLSPHWIVAGRWNRQSFNLLESPHGPVSWGIPLTRWDAALIWRQSQSFEIKGQAVLRDLGSRGPSTVAYAVQALWRF